MQMVGVQLMTFDNEDELVKVIHTHPTPSFYRFSLVLHLISCFFWTVFDPSLYFVLDNISMGGGEGGK